MSHATTRVLGIVGFPVHHSRSPAMHRAAIEALGIDAVYVPFPVAPSRLADAVRGLLALGIAGVNVTLPHKQAIVALLDRVDDAARAIGAVNTVVREGEQLAGYNTDAPGLVRALEEAGARTKGARAVIVGAGGAARAAVVGLAGAGAAEIVVAARAPDKARALLESVRPALGEVVAQAVAIDDGALREACSNATLLVQATSATLEDGPEALALAASLPLDALASGAVVMDVVYEPRETAVLRAANALGLRTVNGLGMLLHQGALAFERFTERAAPLDAMRRALTLD